MALRKRYVRQWFLPDRESPDDRIWTEVQLDVNDLLELLGLAPGTRLISYTYDRDFTVLTFTAEEPKEALCQGEPSSRESSVSSTTGSPSTSTGSS